MDDFKCKIVDLSRDYKTGQAKITILADFSILKFIEKLIDKTLSCRLKLYRNKRSLDANAYAWVLISKIADKMRISKEECYIFMLKNYGQQFVCKIPNKYVEHFRKNTKYFEEHERLEPEEKAQYFKVFVGSSNYDTNEMSIFIEGIVQEAQALDICTMTPNELAILKQRWGSDAVDNTN